MGKRQLIQMKRTDGIDKSAYHLSNWLVERLAAYQCLFGFKPDRPCLKKVSCGHEIPGKSFVFRVCHHTVGLLHLSSLHEALPDSRSPWQPRPRLPEYAQCELTFRQPPSILFPFPTEGVSSMKVILQETMDGVGHLGDLLDVKAGYARNFLLPRKKAVLADSRSIKAFEHIKRVAGERAKKEKLEIESHAKSISAVSITVQAQVGKDDKMFGSVTTKDIAERLAEQGFTVDRRKIQLDHPIKELGTFTVPIKLPRDVIATILIHVVKKQEAETAPAEA